MSERVVTARKAIAEKAWRLSQARRRYDCHDEYYSPIGELSDASDAVEAAAADYGRAHEELVRAVLAEHIGRLHSAPRAVRTTDSSGPEVM